MAMMGVNKMYAWLMILAASYLTSYCEKKYQAIALAMFWEFFLHKVIYHMFINSSESHWVIFLLYALLQTITIIVLNYLKASFTLTMLVFVNMLYNIITAWTRLVDEHLGFYNAHAPFVGAIMFLELLYLGYMSEYVGNYYRKRGIDNHIDRIFCVGVGNLNRSMA